MSEKVQVIRLRRVLAFMSQNGIFSQVPDFSAQKPIHEPRHVKVICIGAGASGLVLAYKLQRSFSNFELIIYEKNEDVSGTWLENRYPGRVKTLQFLSAYLNSNFVNKDVLAT